MSQWIPYDNFRDIKHIADVYSAILKNGIKMYWDFNQQNWMYCSNKEVVLKEINDSRNDISKFLKEVNNLMIAKNWLFITRCIGMSKNPSSQNYIIVMKLYNDSLNKFITKSFLNLRWKSKIYLLYSIATGLRSLHVKNLVHRDLHSGNILITYSSNSYIASNALITDLVLRGNEFTKKGDIYSFGGIIFDVSSERPTSNELLVALRNLRDKCYNKIDNIFNNLRNLKKKNYFLQASFIHNPAISAEAFILFMDYIENIKSGKTQDPNLLKSNNQLLQVLVLILKNHKNALIGKRNSK
ncbi:hypothetical protein Glove_73g39 [Diversispora epigaea]|uniref:Protein kinase domain-containing protein n=1 Tax=Diversispora epigaea TaxID=1348612 RepID=A0A397J9I3_9GLOM|nr:hypothetical protein Glove_73g39 [Diversispora epigaea]